jgi:ubiquinone/menaquinone biosynthesis C-methylase UbiE
VFAKLGRFDNGIWHLSPGRSYFTPEGEYTQQHGLEVQPNPMMWANMARVFTEMGADMSGPALEFGCGTGLLTLTLAASEAYPTVVATDISNAFLEITRGNIERAGIKHDRFAVAILAAEDINTLPAETFSAFYLSSALHHVEDWKGFLESAHRVLRQNGTVYFKEPTAELRALLSTIFQILPTIAEYAGQPLSKVDQERLKLFCNSQIAFQSRIISKSHLEDKHSFRVDEIIAALVDFGYDVRYFINCNPITLERIPLRLAVNHLLSTSFRGRTELLESIQRHLARMLDHIYQLDKHGNPPYHSVMCFAKKR